jgi:dihydrofolate synthase/folylpolyglutamate synthase
MANINGLALFLTSTVLTVSVASACAKSVAVEDYVSTLSKLFQPVKAPSRHVGEPLTTDQVFQQRRGFFSTLFAKTAISKSCKIVHVAGTKGKGSTIEYISSSLINSGKRVGIFTSPHIHTARERAKINRSLISRASMVKYGKVVLELMKDRPWAVFFDLLLALSILYFDEKGVDFLVLETGIGGRYDSTNFADCPAACVITSISLDHQAMLGDTIEKIAYQKAGIIKPNSHVFTPATQKPSVMEVFRRECAALNATLHEVPADK